MAGAPLLPTLIGRTRPRQIARVSAPMLFIGRQRTEHWLGKCLKGEYLGNVPDFEGTCSNAIVSAGECPTRPETF